MKTMEPKNPGERQRVVFGFHAVLARLRADPKSVLEIFVDETRQDGRMKDLVSTAQRAGVKMLVLTHILSELDQPEIRAEILAHIQGVFDGQVVWGEDLMQIDVTAGQSPRSIPHASQPSSA